MRKTWDQAIDARVDALLDQMTLKEMIMQTDQYFSHDFTRRNELGAVAETLFGDHNPSGHLPITFPRHVGQIPCHYSRRPGGGKRYVEMDWLPLYPFGYGLSYTEFAYSDLTLSAQAIAPGETVTAAFTVRNTGERPGAAVPQLYLRDMFASTVKPEMTLAAFEKVFLQPGEEKRVSLTISPKAMRTLDRKFQWHVEPGDFRVFLAENAEKPLVSRDFRVEETSD